MKKIFLIIFILFSLNITVSADYILEKGSFDLVKKYSFSTKNLNKEISRKEFVETLHAWYTDYKADRGVSINYDSYTKLENSKFFKDVDLESDFGKKLSYFASIGAFAKNEYFNPNEKINQKTYFIVMRRLGIMFSLQNCKYHKICELEATKNTPFLKGTYYKYTSKILNKNLRKYYSSPQKYISAGYKPYLNPNYRFPMLRQTLNGCYAFTVRNILKYKHNIGVYVQRGEEHIGKEPKKLWYWRNMNQFDKLAHVEKENAYQLDTLISSLQAGEPVSISYILRYRNSQGQEKSVGHIVAAYSFDEKGVWIAETVTNRRIRLPWNEVFNSYGRVKYHRMFRFKYDPIENWSEKEKKLEKKNNFLKGEF